MLIVMMILLVATTLAGVSLQATEYELRAAGFARSALQTQYVSEAAMTTTMSWVDATSLDGQLLHYLDAWNDNATRPALEQFGEPRLSDAARTDTMRTQWDERQSRLTAVTMPPITRPGAIDPTGSFGPRVPARPGVFDNKKAAAPPDYVVDMYDCRRLQGLGSPGSQVNQGGSGTIKQIQLYCVVTARGRSYVPGGTTRTWTGPDGMAYTVDRFALAHDSRGTVVTPPIIQ